MWSRWAGFGGILRFLNGENNTHETFKRVVARSLTWRVGGFISGMVIAYFFTGRLDLSAEISLVYNVWRFFTHLGHDSLWMRVRWGIRGSR